MREYIHQERDFLVEDYYQGASYEISEHKMYISDPTWGEEVVGDEPHDQLLIDLANTPLFQRLRAIEQLTLPEDYATMPNSTSLSRWQHIWGSVVFVRKMLRDQPDIDPREKMELQLRTLLSDLGHTAFSHLGDWMFQGLNGGENMHDKDLKDILRVSGIEETLNNYGFGLDEVVFPEVQDWIENDSPNLCVDRVDYGMREIVRWGEPTIPFHFHKYDLRDPRRIFDIDPTHGIVMRDEQMARYFATGFSILPTEHWVHPVHRLQLQLFQSAVRSSVIDKVDNSRMHPREAMYGIDDDFRAHFQTWDMLHLHAAMKQIGLAQRQIFVTARRADLNRVFGGMEEPDWQFPDFPDPLTPYTWQSREYGFPYPPQLVIEPADAVDPEVFTAAPSGLQVNLPPLKNREVDPVVMREDGTLRRLTEIDPPYRAYLDGQRAVMKKAYRATLLMRPDVAERIVAHHEQGDEDWARVMQRPRSQELLRRVIHDTGTMTDYRDCFDTMKRVSDERIASLKHELGRVGLL